MRVALYSLATGQPVALKIPQSNCIKCWYLWREENRRKTLGARREPTTKSTHMMPGQRIEHGPHL